MEGGANMGGGKVVDLGGDREVSKCYVGGGAFILAGPACSAFASWCAGF